VGLWGVVARRHLLRRLVAFNVTGAGIFLLFGAVAYRRPDLGGDPVPQAMVLTGIVISLAATAVGAALVVRQAALTGRATLPEETAGQAPGGEAGEGP
jgi:multicomponent Na+:H+ antiporter subunit C